MFFYGPRARHEPPRMIYSQAFRNEQFSPAVALFSAAGLIRTTAGIHEEQQRAIAAKKQGAAAQRKFFPRLLYIRLP